MNEDESICEFHIKLCDIANATFALYEKMYEKKLAKKILKSLHKRFDMKVSAIEEAHDLSSIKVDELIGSLQNFVMSINEIPEKKNKGITFVSNSGGDQGDKEERLLDAITLLRKNFNQSLKNLDRKQSLNVQDKRSDINFQDKGKSGDKINSIKGTQCCECEAFGHIKVECHTFLKKQNMGLSIIWSDFDGESEGENANNVIVYSGRYEAESESSDEE